jgi:hypothetical protein
MQLREATPRIVGPHKLDFGIMNRCMADYKENNLDSINCGELLVKII